MIELVNLSGENEEKGKTSYDRDWFKKIFSCALKILKKRALLVSVICVQDEEMKRLHGAYYGAYRVTDVLSFYYEPHMPQEKKYGEIFLCIPQIQRQAKRYRVSFEKEMRRLFVHGVLHLYGYDHTEPHERKKMVDLTAKILTLCSN